MTTDIKIGVSPATQYLAPLFVKYGIDANTQQPLEHLLSNVNESEFYGLFRLCPESEDNIKDIWYLRSSEFLKLYAKIVVTLRDNTEFKLTSVFLIESLNQFPDTICLFITSFTKANLDLTPVIELCQVSPITLIGYNQMGFKETSKLLNTQIGFIVMHFIRDFYDLKHFMENEFDNLLRDCDINT